jgi:tetratricopeptide (TPR) repeat protein
VIDGVPPRDQYNTALGIVRKALEIDDSLGEAHASLGLLIHNRDWDFAGAEREYRRAIELTPSYASAYHWCAELLVQMGRFDEAFELYRQASELDPLSSAIHSDVGLAWYFARDYDRAIAELQKTIEADATFSRTYHYLAKVYAQVGKYAEAVDAQQKGWLLAGDNPDDIAQRSDGLQAALTTSGSTGFWQQHLQLAQALPSRDAPVELAELHARVSNKDQAFALLERAFAGQRFALLFLNVDPAWDGLRDDPRFRDLMFRIGFPSASADRRVFSSRPVKGE